MFTNLNNIFNSSKIDKRNVKIKNMKSYIETFLNTQSNEKHQLEKINQIPKEINNKVSLNESFFIDEKIKDLQNSIPEPFFDIHYTIDPNVVHFSSDQTLFTDERIKDFEPIEMNNETQMIQSPLNYDTKNLTTFFSNFEIQKKKDFEPIEMNNETQINHTNLKYEFVELNTLFSDFKNNTMKEFEHKIQQRTLYDLQYDNSNELNLNNSIINDSKQNSNNRDFKINIHSSDVYLNTNELDLNRDTIFLNNFIDNNIKMPPKPIDFNILNKINIINNVYKESYKNRYVTGFGDFLRGCYFMLEFCRKFKLKYNIIIQHPIKCLLKNQTNTVPDHISKTIEYCDYANINLDVNCTFNPDTSTIFNEFFYYLNRQDIYNRNLFIYTICYPTNSIHQENKSIIRNIIEPNDDMKSSIDKTLQNLRLNKKQFKVIHLRSGDQYLNKSENRLQEEYKQKILIEISKITQTKANYLLIADNILVKNMIIRAFPFIKTFFKEITHLGENSSLTYENVKNTMIDFYIMSYSNTIFSLSSYGHGSGFSRWCALTYDIPYRCTKI
jgi:hypothetical protein